MRVAVVFSVILCGVVFNLPTAKAIVHAHSVARGEIPYQGQLFIDTEDLGWKGCGASLLTPNYALTAAYCLKSATEMHIVLGNADKNSDSNQTIQIDHWLEYGGYEESTRIHDIALIKLKTPAVLDEFTGTVKLVDSTNRHNDFVGKNARLSGWGQDSYFAAQSPQVLGKLNATVISNEECRKSFDFIDASQMCTSGIDGGYCTGDQGGPLVIDNVQVGVISFGEPYCDGQLPTFHTKVGDYLDWIASNSDYTVDA